MLFFFGREIGPCQLLIVDEIRAIAQASRLSTVVAAVSYGRVASSLERDLIDRSSSEETAYMQLRNQKIVSASV